MKYGTFLNPQTIASKETYPIKFFRRIKNSAYEYEKQDLGTFKGRIAENQETRSFRLLAGVNANSESVFIVCSNLPIDLKPQDKIEFMGQIKTIESIGYYYNDSKLVNASLFDIDYIVARSPKGIAVV